MKKILFTLVAIVLVLNSFSAVGMAFMDHSVHETCPFAVMSTKDCETVASSNESMFHHISAFQSLSEVLLSSSTALLALILSLVACVLLGRLSIPLSTTDGVIERLAIQEKLSIQILDTTLRWISLHNKRNTHLYSWRMVA